MRIYLDNCCYNRPFDDQSSLSISLETQAKLHIQDLIKAKTLELATSFIANYENAQNPYADAEVMSRGFDCLFEILGPVDAERFIAAISRDGFDYTLWQQEHFDDTDAAELAEATLMYDKEHPLK